MFNNEEFIGEYIEALTPPQRVKYLQEIEDFGNYLKERDAIAQRNTTGVGRVVNMQQWNANKRTELETQYKQLINEKANTTNH